MFDRDGCGLEAERRETIQNRVLQKLYRNGWADRSKVIVIDPGRLGYGTSLPIRPASSGGKQVNMPDFRLGCVNVTYGQTGTSSHRIRRKPSGGS